MQKLEAFLPRLLIWVPSCPLPLAEQALVDAAITFCELTDIVQVTLDPITLQPGVTDYELELPTGQEVARVVSTWYGPERQPTGYPRGVNWYPPNILVVPPATNDGVQLGVRVSTKPSRTAKSLDDTLLRDWCDGVIGFAVSRIASIPDQSFSSDMAAAKGSALAQPAFSRAKYEARKGRTTQDLRVQPRPFA